LITPPPSFWVGVVGVVGVVVVGVVVVGVVVVGVEEDVDGVDEDVDGVDDVDEDDELDGFFFSGTFSDGRLAEPGAEALTVAPASSISSAGFGAAVAAAALGSLPPPPLDTANAAAKAITAATATMAIWRGCMVVALSRAHGAKSIFLEDAAILAGIPQGSADSGGCRGRYG
jgi:hypothetical protein